MLSGLLLSCSLASQPHEKDDVEVLEVDAPSYTGREGDSLREACSGWSLSKNDVKRFFQSSNSYRDSPYGEFYQVDCSITGRLRADGRVWDYEINGGGTARWKAEGEVRHWGCEASECRSLVLLPPDAMSGE
ncbi:hypothetical protein GCM10009090_37750 [[Pseudomonas] boreopolis]|uniref:Uncharacterized protein n=2 Tax=Xanthomonas boreopolis TaxID=86183 RepID=A0A919FDD6_9XANT|nr:hypothetical protein GCM10009090_37750 [[Pseudomonas] boreopolis]